MFTAEQRLNLGAPLNKANVKKNPRGFDYVEGWHAIAEANRIFGFDGWDRQTLEMRQLGDPQQVDGKWRVAYHCRVRITVTAGDQPITRDGSGYGSGINKDIRDAHESALKEAETDAMKRALMTFGNPFGLALYDKQQTNVTDEEPLPESAMALMRNFNKAETRDELVAQATSDATKAAMEALGDAHYQQVRACYADNLKRFPKAA